MQITQPSDYVGYKNRQPSPHDDDEKHGYYPPSGQSAGGSRFRGMNGSETRQILIRTGVRWLIYIQTLLYSCQRAFLLVPHHPCFTVPIFYLPRSFPLFLTLLLASVWLLLAGFLLRKPTIKHPDSKNLTI